MIKTISKRVRLKMLNLFRDFYRDYTRDKYGITGDVCFIYSHDGEDLFYMTDTTQGVCKVSDKACKYIRQLIGSNKLNEYGPPLPDQIIPQVVLVPSLSMLKVMGPKKFIQFLKEWKGSSHLGDIEVIRYSVMK